MNIESYIIHLERAKSRKNNAKLLLETLPCKCQIFYATDGMSLKSEVINESYRKNLFKPHFPFHLSKGEIGIFISYRNVWKDIVKRNIDAALIIEDDICIDYEQFKTAYNLAIKNIDHLEYIQLQRRSPRKPIRVLETVDDVCLYEQLVIGLGMCCQIVSKNAAKRLLIATSRFDRPIDTLLQLRHITGQIIYSLYPSGITEISNAMSGSTIHTGKNGFSLIRELQRYSYRRKVKTCSLTAWHMN